MRLSFLWWSPKACLVFCHPSLSEKSCFATNLILEPGRIGLIKSWKWLDHSWGQIRYRLGRKCRYSKVDYGVSMHLNTTHCPGKAIFFTEQRLVRPHTHSLSCQPRDFISR